MPATLWHRVRHVDPRARELADRHYSRQTIGAREFTPPGNKIVLLHMDAAGVPRAVWASHRPDPASGVKRSDGLDVWACSLFRNEQADVPASALIREAVAITRGIWTDVLPAGGFWTTVNPRHVAATPRRGGPVYGYCFIKAGWQLQEARTKRRGLVVLSLALDQLVQVAPLTAPWDYGLPLFGAAAKPA